MVITFIARMIEQETDKSLEKGRDKYRAYFVNTRLYQNWRDEVNSILEVDGYADVIVEE